MFQSLLVSRYNILLCCRCFSRSSQVFNHYETLGVSTNASQKEIRHAFLKLSKKLHPDIAGKASNDKFARLNEAYNVLKDDNKRRSYDTNCTGSTSYTKANTYYHPGSRRVVYRNRYNWNEATSQAYRGYRKEDRERVLRYINHFPRIFIFTFLIFAMLNETRQQTYKKRSKAYAEKHYYKSD